MCLLFGYQIMTPCTSAADTKDAVYELFYYSIGTLISPCATEIYAILVFMPANSSLVVALMESRDLSALVVQLKIAKSLQISIGEVVGEGISLLMTASNL